MGDKQFAAMLFPCNQFLSQEPSSPTPQTIKRMSTNQLNLEAASSSQVVVMEKVDVNGKGAHPVFEFLRYNSSLYNDKTGLMSPIQWNFGKFLVEPGGGVYKYYSPSTDITAILPDIEKLLSGEGPSNPCRAPLS